MVEEKEKETNEKVGNNNVPAKKDVIANKKEIMPFDNSNSINSINLLNPDDVAKACIFLERMIKTDKGGIKTVNDGLAIIARAQDLKLPFTTCIENIHVINGKTGINIHVIKALLSRAGVTWNCDKDYAPLYEYTDGFNVFAENLLAEYHIKCINQEKAEEINKENSDKIGVYPVKFYKDFNGNVYKDYQLSKSKFGIAINMQSVASIKADNKIPIYRIPAIPIDYISQYTLTRIVNNIVVTSIGKFSYNEAMNAKLFEKDTYNKYAKTLIGHRAFTYAARDIASDILFGVMETTELKIMNDINITDSDIIDIS